MPEFVAFLAIDESTAFRQAASMQHRVLFEGIMTRAQTDSYTLHKGGHLSRYSYGQRNRDGDRAWSVFIEEELDFPDRGIPRLLAINSPSIQRLMRVNM